MTAPSSGSADKYGSSGYGQPAPYGQSYPTPAAPGSGSRGPTVTFGVLALLGGVVAAIGSFLTWASIGLPAQAAQQIGCDEITVNGIGNLSACGMSTSEAVDPTNDGWFTLVGGVLLVIGGLLILMAVRTRIAGGVIGLIGGLVAGGIGIYDLLTIEDRFFEGVPEQARSLIDLGFGMGLWMVVVGGVVGFVFAIAGLAKKS